MLIVAPVVLTWTEAVRKRQRLSPPQSVEAVVALACLAASAWVALGPVDAWRVHPGPYFLFPVLLWTAVRFGPIGAATGTLVVAGFAIMHASLGNGPFAIATTAEASAVLETSAFLA